MLKKKPCMFPCGCQVICPITIGLIGVISETYLSFGKGSYLFILIFLLVSNSAEILSYSFLLDSL